MKKIIFTLLKLVIVLSILIYLVRSGRLNLKSYYSFEMHQKYWHLWSECLF